MKQKHLRTSRARYIISGIIVLAVVATAYIMFIVKPGSSEVAASSTSTSNQPVTSEFTFTGTANWYQGPTRTGDMVLFHKIQDSCFVSIQHIQGSMTAKQAKKEATDTQLAQSGYTLTNIGIQNMTIKTNTGVKQYPLQQTRVSDATGAPATDSTQLDGGTEAGYLPLGANDFIYVEGNCETADELAATIPALQAITFDANKGK